MFLKENDPQADRGFACNRPFRDRVQVSHPQKLPPKGEGDSWVPTSTKESNSHRATEELLPICKVSIGWHSHSRSERDTPGP
jgi:hypothetical protein